jgi:capsid protein
MRKADIEDLRAGLITATDITERRGESFEDVVMQRAKELVLQKRIAEENGLQLTDLAILTKPGDMLPEQNNNNPEQTDDQNMV